MAERDTGLPDGSKDVVDFGECFLVDVTTRDLSLCDWGTGALDDAVTLAGVLWL